MGLITEAYRRKYLAGFHLLAERNQAVLTNWTTPVPGNQAGKTVSVDRIGSIGTTEVTNLGAEKTFAQPDHTRRVITSRVYDANVRVFDADVSRVMEDYNNEYRTKAVAAVARRRDKVVADAMIGTAFEGENGATSVALPTDQKDTASATISSARLLTAAEKFMSNDYDIMGVGLHVAIGPRQLKELQQDSDIKSADFNDQKPLSSGTLLTWNVFTFHVTTGLSTTGSVRHCIVWHPSAVYLHEPTPMKFDMDINKQVNGDPVELYHKIDIGCGRVEDEGVYQIDCNE